MKILPSQLTDKNWKAGGITGITFKQNTNGNWRPWKKTDQTQLGTGGDDEDCLTFSSNDSLEVYLNFLIATNQLPAAHLKFLQDNGYFNTAGGVAFSKRFNAILNGTTRDGNSILAVLQSARGVGFIPESLLPSDPNLPWNVYYDRTKITPEMLALGKQFNTFFVLLYEFVVSGATTMTDEIRATIRLHNQQAPLQVVLPICPNWNNPTVAACARTATDHGVFFENTNLAKGFGIEDTYTPYDKVLDEDYFFPWVVKMIHVPLDQTKFAYMFTKSLDPNAPHANNDIDEVRAWIKMMMQMGLYYDPNIQTFADADEWGGYYAEATNIQAAIITFQKKYGIVPAAGIVGPKTLQIINNLQFNS